MPVYPVDSTPKLITGRSTAPYILKNSGAKTVYIGQDSSLTITARAFSITAGGVMQWPGNSTEIWAMTDAGQESEIEILYDSQAQYTPGPEFVTINSTSETLIDSLPVTIPFFNTYVNVGDYASLTISVDADARVLGAIYSAQDVLGVFVYWVDPVTLAPITQDFSTFTGAGRGTVQLNVKANTARIVVQRIDGGAPGNVTLNVVGSRIQLPERYVNLPEIADYSLAAFTLVLDNQAFGPWLGQYSVRLERSGSGNSTIPIPSVAGPAMSTFTRHEQTGTGTSSTILFIDGTAAVYLGQQRTISLGTTAPGNLDMVNVPMLLPRAPISARLASSATGVSVRSDIGLTFQN